jgi:hypothetical protein
VPLRGGLEAFAPTSRVSRVASRSIKPDRLKPVEQLHLPAGVSVIRPQAFAGQLRSLTGPVANFFRPVCELRGNTTRPHLRLWVRGSDDRIFVINRAPKNFATDPLRLGSGSDRSGKVDVRQRRSRGGQLWSGYIIAQAAVRGRSYRKRGVLHGMLAPAFRLERWYAGASIQTGKPATGLLGMSSLRVFEFCADSQKGLTRQSAVVAGPHPA